MGSMIITSFNNEYIIFMKEISSDGDISTIDVIYPAYPFLLLFNKDILRDVLKPVIKYANNEFINFEYTQPFAPHHLGTWPYANIQQNEQENMPIEETSNILIMIKALEINNEQ